MKSSNPWFVTGLITGAAVGASLALLYTPASGRELLDWLQRHLAQARQEAREAGMRAEAEILTRYKTIRAASLEAHPGRGSLVPAVP